MTKIVAHKDTDGQTSSTLWEEAHTIKEQIHCPSEFGLMKRDTQFMFDMNPKWQTQWDDLEAASKLALQNLTVYDHHIQTERNLHYKLVRFAVPTSAGILLKYWNNLDKDRWWIGCVGASGDRFNDWYVTEGPKAIFPKIVLDQVFHQYPELKNAQWYYPRSARRTREIDGVWRIDPSTAYTLNPANYISSLLNAEYRTDFFRGVIQGQGFWQPKIGIEGLRQCGDPLTFTLSKWGDALFERKDPINRAADYAVSGLIQNIQNYRPDPEEEEFSGHTVEGRHTLLINNFAIVFFKSTLDIGSLVATKCEENLGVTSIALNRFPVMGSMHCSIRGSRTGYVINKLRESGFSGGGHETAGGAMVQADQTSYNDFIQAVRRL